MVIHNSFPDIYHSCLVQINWPIGTGFFLAENFQDGLNTYSAATLVAIFKCKPKLKP